MSFLRRTVVCFEICSEDPDTLVKNTTHIKRTAQMTDVKSYKPIAHSRSLCICASLQTLPIAPGSSQVSSFYERKTEEK